MTLWFTFYITIIFSRFFCKLNVVYRFISNISYASYLLNHT